MSTSDKENNEEILATVGFFLIDISWATDMGRDEMDTERLNYLNML